MSRSHFPRHVIELVTGRSGGHCECMSSGCTLVAEHTHHRRPKGLGGTRRPESQYASNALAVCARCHLRIHAMPTWARDNGFLVRQSDDPAAVPVWWRCAGHGQTKDFVFLDGAGHLTPTPNQQIGEARHGYF